MKRYFLILIALSITTTLFAQQPFGKNATWFVQYENEFGFYGYKEIAYSNDTLINNQNWQMFSVSGAREIRTGPNPGDILQWQISGATFGLMFMTRNDSVFSMNITNGVTRMLYDYGAQVGDVWQIAPWDTTLGCVDTPQVTVMAVGYDTINGVPIKYWDLVDPQDTISYGGGSWYGCSAGHCMGGRMYERIGAMYGSLNLRSLYNFTAVQNICGFSSTFPSYFLRCYKDDSLNINLTSRPCGYWPFIGIDENNALTNIKIYPNPATNYLRLSGMQNENLTWKIFDLSGRVLLRGKLENGADEIYVQSLSSGMYFLKLNGKTSLRFMKE